MSAAIASIAPPPPIAIASQTAGYFQRNLPTNLILGTFFAVTLPLAAFIWLNNTQLLMWGYLWLFGMTHFVLTFTVYLNQGNLAYFGSTWRNRLVYFALPAAIFVGFDLLHVFHVREAFPLFTLYLFAAIRLTDFNHFGRQSFGVLQMFKAATGDAYPKRVKDIENWFFKVVTVFVWTTFLSGGVSPFLQEGGSLTIGSVGWRLADPVLPIYLLQCIAAALLLTLAGLLAVLIVTHRQARSVTDPIWIDKPLAYLCFQTGGTLLTAIAFPLYAAALAIHYVEYHVLMYPRCFNSRLDETCRLDRFFAQLRRSPIVFYAALLTAAGIATLFCFTGMGLMGMSTLDLSKPPAYLVIVALFDGLFVFHYLVEAYIWRFSEPFYRKSLSGLYFAPRKA